MHLAGLLSAYFALPTNGTAGFVRHFVELEQAGDEQVSNEASKEDVARAGQGFPPDQFWSWVGGCRVSPICDFRWV